VYPMRDRRTAGPSVWAPEGGLLLVWHQPRLVPLAPPDSLGDGAARAFSEGARAHGRPSGECKGSRPGSKDTAPARTCAMHGGTPCGVRASGPSSSDLPQQGAFGDCAAHRDGPDGHHLVDRTQTRGAAPSPTVGPFVRVTWRTIPPIVSVE